MWVAAAATVLAAAAEFTVVVAALFPGLTQMTMISVVEVVVMPVIWLLLLLDWELELLFPEFLFELLLSTCVVSDDPSTTSFRATRNSRLRKSMSKVPANAKGATQRAATALILMMNGFLYIRRLVERGCLIKQSKLSKLL